MQTPFTEKESLANKIYIVHLCLFLLTLPFERFYSEVILISLLFHTLFHFNKKGIQDFPLKKTVYLQIVFYPSIIFMVSTPFIGRALTDAEIQLAILIFPFILASNRTTLVKYKSLLLNVWVTGCIIAISYCEFDAIRIILFNHLPFKALFSDNFINNNFTEPLAIHPTYLAMYVALSISILMHLLIQTKDLTIKAMTGVGILLLTVSLIQLGSKSVLIVLLLIVLAALIINRKRLSKKRQIYFVLVPLGIILSTIYVFQDLKIRFVQNLYDDIANTQSGKSKNEFRIVRWKAALQVIKESPILGHGAGSEIPALKREYYRRKLYNSYINELNAHNEYLSLLIKFGIVGLVIFLCMLFWGFNYAIRENDFVFLSFLIIITLVSISENILDVNKGVFFYSFFFSFFMFKKINTGDIFIPQKQPGELNNRFNQ